MSLLTKLKEAFNRTGHVHKLNKTFEEHELDIPIGIKMHYAGIDGIDENRLVIREYANGHTGDAILKAEWDPIQETWELRETPSLNTIATINGEENYDALAHEIATHLRQKY